MAHTSLPPVVSTTCSQPAWACATLVSNAVWHRGAHSYRCSRTTKTSTLLKLRSWTPSRSFPVLCLRLCTSGDSAHRTLWSHSLHLLDWKRKHPKNLWVYIICTIAQNYTTGLTGTTLQPTAAKPWKHKDYMGQEKSELSGSRRASSPMCKGKATASLCHSSWK